MASKDAGLTYEEITRYVDSNGREYALELGSDGELYRKPRNGGRRKQLTLGQARLDLTEAGAQDSIDALGRFLADKTLTMDTPVATVVAASKIDAALSDDVAAGSTETKGRDMDDKTPRDREGHMADSKRSTDEAAEESVSATGIGQVHTSENATRQTTSENAQGLARDHVEHQGTSTAHGVNAASQPVSAAQGTASDVSSSQVPSVTTNGAKVPPYGYQQQSQVAPHVVVTPPAPAAHGYQAAPAGAPVPPMGSQQPSSTFVTPVPTKPVKAPRKTGSGMTVKAVFAGVLGGAVVVLAGLGIGFGTGALHTGGATGSQTVGTSVLNVSKDATDDGDGTLAEQVAQKVIPSVASITVTTTDSSMSSLLSGASGTTATGVGSGSVLDTQGHILTNYHVVQDAKTISVSLNGKEYENATVVGYDESSDLAVIKIDPGSDTLVPIEIADSDDVKVGQWVMSVGSPFGNEQSVSTGIVSSLYRNMALPSETGTSIYANMIQTDAAINPGNSGGALVNRDGKLIGVNSIIESSSGSSSGVGFAIPSTYATSVAQQIIDGKTVEHPAIGATVSTVSGSSARKVGASEGGALIQSVTAGGAAASAGLQKGDVITKVDDDDITGADALIIAIRAHAVGDKVKMTYVRNGQTSTTEVTLGSDANTSKGQSDKSGDASSNADNGSNGTSGDAGSSSSSADNGTNGSSEDAEQRFQDFVDRLRNGRRNG